MPVGSIFKVDQSSKNLEYAYRLQSLSSGRWLYDVRLSFDDGYGRESRNFVLLS